MMQGTTPYLFCRIKERNLGQAEVIVITFKQGGRLWNYGMDRITIVEASDDASVLAIHLTQEETLSIRPQRFRLQVRWRNADGEADGTKIIQGENAEALLKEVI